MTVTLPADHTPQPGETTRLWHVTLSGFVALGVRLALGGLFVYAAWNKLRPPVVEGGTSGPQSFADSVRAFKLGLPDWATRAATSVTPWVELIAGALLILGIWVRGASVVIGALLVVFIALIVSVLDRGLSVECGCFGKMSPFCPDKVGMCNIIQNSLMLAGAVFLLLTPRTGICGKSC